MKKINVIIAIVVSLVIILSLCSCMISSAEEASSAEASSAQYKTVQFPQNMNPENLTDTELKNKVFNLLDGLDPNLGDPYSNAWPNPEVDDPEALDKISSLGTEAMPYILLYVLEKEIPGKEGGFYFQSVSYMIQKATGKENLKDALGEYTQLSYEDTEITEKYTPWSSQWWSYEILCNLAGKTLPEEVK